MATAAPAAANAALLGADRPVRALPEPRHRDVECRGFEVVVDDPSMADPWRLGVEVLAAL